MSTELEFFESLSLNDIAYLNGYRQSCGEATILKYEMITPPPPACWSETDHTTAELDGFADWLNDLTQEEANEFVEAVAELTAPAPRLGTPGKPSRLVRTT